MRSPRPTARIFISTLATLVVLSTGEGAQAACYGTGEQLSAQTLSQFTNNAGRLLTQFPSGGPQMISLIRDLVASDPGTLPLIINLNAKANPEQVQAIGTGLGQAALVCRRTAERFSNEIQEMTVAASNQPLTQAFAGVMGDQFLGLAGPSIGGGGAEATGLVGSVGGAAVSLAPLDLATSLSTTKGHSSTLGASFAPASAPQGGASAGGSSGRSSTILAGSPGTPGNPTGQHVPNTNKPTSTSPSRP